MRMPGYNHRAMPEVILQAFISLGILWEWYDVVIVLLVGFFGLLRPKELSALQASDILTPYDLGSTTRSIFVRIANPKMKRLAARREHVRIDEPIVVSLLEAYISLCPSSDALVFSYSEFADSFSKLCVRFSVLVAKTA